jgi:serine/threonine protein kinase
MTTAVLEPGDALSAAYTVAEHLSRGESYDVYSVWSAERDCLCIAKVLRPDRRGDKTRQARLIQEGCYLTGFSHPHLVRGYEVVPDAAATGPIVVTETLPGATLSRLVQDSPLPGLNPGDAAQLGRQLCSALHYLHHQGLVHRDLKPSNIVCVAGRAVVLDIDLARPPGPCRAGAGTLQYMAPEQLTDESVGYPADIWGLGGVLYRALTGRRPFPGAKDRREHTHTTDLTRLERPEITFELRQLVADCLAVTPVERPGLDAVRQRLDAVLAQTETSAA